MERIRRALSLFVPFVLLAVVGGAAFASTGSRDAAARGARWIASRQTKAGDLPSYSGSGVGDEIVALLAGGESSAPVDRALAFVRSKGASLADSPAHAARIVMGLVAAGANARSFNGVDYVSRIHVDATTGAYDANVYADALAMLGAAASGARAPSRAVTYLRAQQCATGGFAWKQGCAAMPDSDTTSIAMSALLASGVARTDTATSRARSFLSGMQNADGGFGLGPGDPTNANSTGLALSAIAALGEDPRASPWRRAGGADPVSALVKLQSSDGGFRYLASSSGPGDYATVQAVPGLDGIAYPMPVVRRDPSVAPAPVATISGSGSPPVTATTNSASRSPSPSTGRHRAGVVIRNLDGSISTHCVDFVEPTITGTALLVRTKVPAVISHSQLGDTLCSLDGHGCGTAKCFCNYPDFWGYWSLDPLTHAWKFSSVGMAVRVVTDGSVDAWAWGKDGKPAPPPTTIDAVCVAQAASQVSAPPRHGPGAGSSTSLLAFGLAALALAAAGALAVWRRRAARA